MNKIKISEELFDFYIETKNVKKFYPFGGGHINETFLVETKANNKYILQRVNKNVFRTEAIVHNYDIVLEHIFKYQKENNIKITPDIIKSKNNKFHIIDKEGYAWRLAEFIPGCKAYSISPNRKISYMASKAIGKFQLFLNTLPVNKFDYTIINFHDPQRRLKVFKDTVNESEQSVKNDALPEIEFSLKNSDIVNEYENIANLLPEKVTHNDTKLDNILFYDSNKTIVIDLDTIMPSTILFDYGDMVRTFTSPALEDEKDISKTSFRTEHFEALTKGYLEGLENNIEEIEKDNLILGAKTIIYEQVLRFLTDYLQGNPYYKVKYPEHNLIRTRTQIKILDTILKKEESLRKYILLI
jgi:thiamine kinase-like enzyme